MAQGGLRSIRIQNFRRFADLEIPRLGMVNLLVGRNNTGKSSVLEAVRLLVSDGSLDVLQDVADRREERGAATLSEEFLAFSALIRRGTPHEDGFRISDGEQFIEVRARLRRRVTGDESGLENRYEPVPNGSDRDGFNLLLEVKTPQRLSRVSTNVRMHLERPPDPKETGCVFIGTGGLTRQEITSLWGVVLLTEIENRINRSMGLVFPEVEKVSIVPGDRVSHVIAKVRDVERPVALKSLGEGSTRYFGLALAAANAQNGVLLVDEVEIGLHYSNQIAMWRLLVQMALDFQVQIFATTHSEDAIRAFSIATKENEAVDGRLIRLQSRGGEIEAVEYDEGRLWDSRNAEMEIR